MSFELALIAAFAPFYNPKIYNRLRNSLTGMDELIAQVNHDEPPPQSNNSRGWVEVIAGSMFSGKSEELIRRLRRAKIARQKVQVFKPRIDARFSDHHIVSHSEMRHESANRSHCR